MDTHATAPAGNERLFIPALAGLYASLDGVMDALVRITLGALLIPHGLQKVFGMMGGLGMAGNAALFDKIGWNPGWFWGGLVAYTELVGGALLVLGLLTRPVAAAVAIFSFNAIIFTSKMGGFFWNKGGSEYSILLLVCALLVLIRGGGRLSLDRAIGREL